MRLREVASCRFGSLPLETDIDHRTPHTRDDGCDPEAVLCF